MVCFHSLESKILESGEFCGFFLCCIPLNGFSFVVVQSLSHVQLFRPSGLHHTRLPCPSPSPGAWSNSYPLSHWWSNHLVLCHALLLSIFPSIRALSNELALCIKWLQYWNFSVSPSNEYWELISFRLFVSEKAMATHSSVLAWRIPESAEPGGLPPMGSHRVGHDWSDLAAAAAAFPYLLQFPSQLLIFYYFLSISYHGPFPLWSGAEWGSTPVQVPKKILSEEW